MTSLIALINFAGFVALLLWGVRMVQTGVERAYGAQLRQFLARALGNRFKALLSGLGITALLQSSTATGLMITSFTAGGFVALVPGLAVMLGANIGTTLIVQVLSFDLSFAAPLLMLVGVGMFRRGRRSRTQDLGRVAIGLGLILLSLSQLLLLFSHVEDSSVLQQLLDLAAQAPLADLMIAALLAWAAHSSVAVVLVIMSMTVHGSLDLSVAFAMVLGANLGSAVNPVLEANGEGGASAKRLPLGNLFNRLLGCVLVMPFVGHLQHLFAGFDIDAGRLVADFHTLFNIVMALVFLPFLGLYARFLKRVIRGEEVESPGRPIYLDSKARSPSIALAQASREALRMTDLLENMLKDAIAALADNDRKQMSRTRGIDGILHQLDNAIKTYLGDIDRAELSDHEQARAVQILAFVSNIENASDTLNHNILKPLAKKAKKGVELSGAGHQEVLDLLDQLLTNTHLAASVFMSRDSGAAQRLIDEKRRFRELEMRATEAHFLRLQAGRIASHETSRLHMQLVHALKRVNNYLVEGAAYPLQEGAPLNSEPPSG